MGRRHEPLHEALLAFCEARGLRYVYYSNDGRLTTEELRRLTSSAQYFVATPPDLANPKRSGGFSPLGMRYFEGLAAGTRLLGVLPRSGEYKAVPPTNGFCQVSPDSSYLAERLDEDRSNPPNQRAGEAASEFVKRTSFRGGEPSRIFNRLATGAAIDLRFMHS
jgi:hypothetical protein